MQAMGAKYSSLVPSLTPSTKSSTVTFKVLNFHKSSFFFSFGIILYNIILNFICYRTIPFDTISRASKRRSDEPQEMRERQSPELEGPEWEIRRVVSDPMELLPVRSYVRFRP
jgi:hypothetical protein